MSSQQDQRREELVQALQDMTHELDELSQTAVEYEKVHGFPKVDTANDLAALVARDTARAIAPVVGLLVVAVAGLLDTHEG